MSSVLIIHVLLLCMIYNMFIILSVSVMLTMRIDIIMCIMYILVIVLIVFIEFIMIIMFCVCYSSMAITINGMYYVYCVYYAYYV